MSLDDTLYARDDEMDEFGDSGAYGDSLEEDYEEEEEEEEAEVAGVIEPQPEPATPAPAAPAGGGGSPKAPRKPAAKKPAKKKPVKKAAKKKPAEEEESRAQTCPEKSGEEEAGAQSEKVSPRQRQTAAVNAFPVLAPKWKSGGGPGDLIRQRPDQRILIRRGPPSTSYPGSPAAETPMLPWAA